jgi:site-specific DNA-cytosine methylase
MNHLLLASSRIFTPDADMRVSSFFAGIGGFDLGLERAGMNVVFQCEIDPFCQQILKRHWPHVPLHEDITTLNPATIPAADLWCAGWPCQDLSTANTERTGLSERATHWQCRRPYHQRMDWKTNLRNRNIGTEE